MEECKDNKVSCGQTKLTIIGKTYKEKCADDDVNCDQVLLSTPTPRKRNKGKKNRQI